MIFILVTIGDSEHQIHETELVAVPRTNLNIEQDECKLCYFFQLFKQFKS